MKKTKLDDANKYYIFYVSKIITVDIGVTEQVEAPSDAVFLVKAKYNIHGVLECTIEYPKRFKGQSFYYDSLYKRVEYYFNDYMRVKTFELDEKAAENIEKTYKKYKSDRKNKIQTIGRVNGICITKDFVDTIIEKANKYRVREEKAYHGTVKWWEYTYTKKKKNVQ